MRPRTDRGTIWLVAVFAVSCFAWTSAQKPSDQAGRIALDPDDIGGTVTSSNGPEAGVWVVAETTGLPTKFVRIVVTDDQGRYVLPDLPNASYEIFVRGYGLADSPRVVATRGRRLDLQAVVAPNGRVAAKVYPPSFWFSLMEIAKGPVPEQEVVSIIKECLQCHPIGNEGTREIRKTAGPLSSLEAWDQRVKRGQMSGLMNAAYQRLGAQRKMFADWSDRIAAGAYPEQPPPRPSGRERNAVITVWDWAWPEANRSDAQGTYDWSPRVNAEGLVYGAHGNGSVLVWVNPKENTVGEIKTDANGLRSVAIDDQSRVWVTASLPQGASAPDFCKPGSANKFSKYFQLSGRGKQLVMYDPKTKQVLKIPTCMPVDHNFFGREADKPLYFGQAGYIGWVSTVTYDTTKDTEASQGWCPTVLDTNGDGRITEWTEPDSPVDPTKDHRISAGCYSIAVSPLDGSLWCSGIGENDRTLVRIERGANPPQSCKAEVYTPPSTALPVFKSGGVAVDPNGIAWLNWRGSEQVMSFDRRKCRTTNGPKATGAHCPEGWTSHQMDRPKFLGTSVPAHAEMMYLTQIDRHNVLGLGSDAVISGPVNSYSLQVLVPGSGQFLDLVVPYPMGFFSRSAQGRIDDPQADWKGRGLWSNFSTYTPHFIEGGTGPKVVKFQMRPHALAK